MFENGLETDSEETVCKKRDILTEDDRSVEKDPLFLTDPDNIISKDEDHLRNGEVISIYAFLHLTAVHFYEVAILYVLLRCESYKNIKCKNCGPTLKPHATGVRTDIYIYTVIVTNCHETL